jgi:hypothetical protein
MFLVLNFPNLAIVVGGKMEKIMQIQEKIAKSLRSKISKKKGYS